MTRYQTPLGALHYALRKSEPRHRGAWAGAFPGDDKAEALRRRAQAEADQRVKQHASLAAVEHKRDVEKQLLLDFEARYGEQLDAIPLTELLQQLELPPAVVPHLKRFGPKSPMVRPDLLRAFAARAASN